MIDDQQSFPEEEHRGGSRQGPPKTLSLPSSAHMHHNSHHMIQTVDQMNQRLFSDNLLVTSADSSLSKYQCLLNNLEECASLANRMKSLLGPRSRDKLLIDRDGEISVTNDGATALLFVNHRSPAAKILTQLSVSMDDDSGDGTTSVVILAGALLNQASYLIKNYSVHPRWIIRGYTVAMQLALDFLSSSSGLSQSIEPFQEEYRNVLLQVARTCLNSKIASYSAPKLADIAVSAILNSGGSEKRVHVIRGGVSIENPMVSGFRGGTSMEESFIVPGNNVVLQSKSMFGNHLNLKQVKVAVITFELEIAKGISSHQYKIDVPSLSQLDRLIKEEETYFKKMVVYLKKIGVQLLCIQESVSGLSSTVSDTAKNWIKRSKIELLVPMKLDEIEHLCQVFHIAPILSYEQLQSLAEDKPKAVAHVKQVDEVQSHTIGEQDYTILYTENSPETKDDRHSTVVLRAPSQIAIDELERALHDTLRVLSTLVSQPKLLPGGGTCEISASVFLQMILDGEATSATIDLQTVSSVELMVIQCFRQAIEEIPLTLCQNAGASPVSTLNQLKRTHKRAVVNNTNEKLRLGIFIPQNLGPTIEVADMFQKGIIEPYASKYAQWQMATNAALQILKIDGMFLSKDNE